MCPRCKKPLEQVVDKDVVFLGCGTCFGLFVPDAALQTYVSRAATSEATVVAFTRLLAVAIAKAKEGDELTLRRCPTCDRPLDRLAFGGEPLVILDRCPEHGVWLDRTELKKVVRSARKEAHPHSLDDDDDDDAAGPGPAHA